MQNCKETQTLDKDHYSNYYYFLIQITRKRQGIFFTVTPVILCLFQSRSDVQFAFCINLVDLILCVFSFYDTRGHYLFSYKQRGIISHEDSPGAGVFTDPCCNLNIFYISHIIIPEKNIFEKKFLLCDDKKKNIFKNIYFKYFTGLTANLQL